MRDKPSKPRIEAILKHYIQRRHVSAHHRGIEDRVLAPQIREQVVRADAVHDQGPIDQERG
jgi:hypothetical protein